VKEKENRDKNIRDEKVKIDTILKEI